MKTQKELVREEQRVLDDLIHEMDNVLLKLDRKLTDSKLQAQKAKDKCLPDTYGMLISAEDDKIATKEKIRDVIRSRNELYENRLILEYDDQVSQGEVEIKVGLHSYMHGANVYITTWKMPICRHYILDNAATEYDCVVRNRNGEKYDTHYQLKMKRHITLFFDTVKKVTHFYPSLDEETEKIIADEFLQELVNRRSEEEFKNIVFSIQRQQGAIIQTPFEQNLIVQGCAGSGKSMIMLHRLPIIIYDNPNSLDRNNLYIITPSIAYIQMAENMRMDLEIEDLKMGTLEQYYNHVIRKYGRNEAEYGKIKPFIKLDPELEKYVYSAQCVVDMKQNIEMQIAEKKADCTQGYSVFKLKDDDSNRRNRTCAENVRGEILSIQNIINANEKVLRVYFKHLKSVVTYLEELAKFFETRKIAVERAVDKKITIEQKAILEAKKDLEKIDKESHELMYQNRMNTIESAQKKIDEYMEVKEIIDLDDDYFDALREMAQKIRQVMDIVWEFHPVQEKITLENQYRLLSKREFLCESCISCIDEIRKIDDAYWEYVAGWKMDVHNLDFAAKSLAELTMPYISFEYLQQLFEARSDLEKLNESIALDNYLKVMKKLGQEPDEKGRLTALECSPYLYLQSLYMYYGRPQSAVESLITIDEAQNLEVEELRLIKGVNNNTVIFNLFGDVKQHVEGSKGIDSWNDIDEIAEFEVQNMRENYRNASQITNYCNNRFHLDMRAIILDGKGVHEIFDKKLFENELDSVFQKPISSGLSAIIVKNADEADLLLQHMSSYRNRLNNMTRELKELKKGKWNLMTADQIKGLEFETVFAISGKMTTNEKYIAYTRALDELYVYDGELPWEDEADTDVKNENEEQEQKDTTVDGLKNGRKKREKKKVNTKQVKEFFEEHGLMVVDLRSEKGYLWVVGDIDDIKPVVDEAINTYKITGEYTSERALNINSGWATKTKK